MKQLAYPIEEVYFNNPPIKFFQIQNRITQWRNDFNVLLSNLNDFSVIKYLSDNYINHFEKYKDFKYKKYIIDNVNIFEYLKSISIYVEIYLSNNQEFYFKNFFSSNQSLDFLEKKVNLFFFENFFKIWDLLYVQTFVNHYKIKKYNKNIKVINYKILYNRETSLNIENNSNLNIEFYYLINVEKTYSSFFKG